MREITNSDDLFDTMYAAVLIAPDGEYVTDFERDTIDEVWDCVNDMGSRWYFYPFPVVAQIVETFAGIDTTRSTVVSWPDGVRGSDVPLSELLADVRSGELEWIFAVMCS